MICATLVNTRTHTVFDRAYYQLRRTRLTTFAKELRFLHTICLWLIERMICSPSELLLKLCTNFYEISEGTGRGTRSNRLDFESIFGYFIMILIAFAGESKAI